MDLLETWAAWEPSQPPYILPEDDPHLPPADDRLSRSWVEHRSHPTFGTPGDTRLHLGLLPHPYAGRVRDASIYILMLNPGVGWQDYFGEYELPQFRKAVLATLRQQMPGDQLPFMYLDPQFAWHGGFGWWHGKLAGVIAELSKRWKLEFAEARARLANELASIELVPYHSNRFKNARGMAKKLHSAKLAKNFVHDHVLPKVRDGRAIVIVARKVKVWDLPNCDGITQYDKGEAQGAHLTPKSRGGLAILDFLS